MKLFVCKNGNGRIVLFNAIPTRILTGFEETFEWNGYLNSETDIQVCDALIKRLEEIEEIKNMTHCSLPVEIEIDYDIKIANNSKDKTE